MRILRIVKATPEMEGVATGMEIAIIKEAHKYDDYGIHFTELRVRVNREKAPKPVWEILPEEIVEVYEEKDRKKRDFFMSLTCGKCSDLEYGYNCRRHHKAVQKSQLACRESCMDEWERREGKEPE